MTNGTAVASRMTNGIATTSKMTNRIVSRQAGSSFVLQYKEGASGGSRTIAIPAGIPIVAIEPGESADLQPGVHVFVVASRNSGEHSRLIVCWQAKTVVPPM